MTWKKKHARTPKSDTAARRSCDRTLAMAELYASLVTQTAEGQALDAVGEAARGFYLCQRCEVLLRNRGMLGAVRDPHAAAMADALGELGAAQTAGLFEQALQAREQDAPALETLCRDLDARWRLAEDEIDRYSTAWALNHGLLQ